jgi:hypothetical protein
MVHPEPSHLRSRYDPSWTSHAVGGPPVRSLDAKPHFLEEFVMGCREA